MFDWIGWYRYGYAVGNTAWHLIGLFESSIQAGRYRTEYRDGKCWMIPVQK